MEKKRKREHESGCKEKNKRPGNFCNMSIRNFSLVSFSFPVVLPPTCTNPFALQNALYLPHVAVVTQALTCCLTDEELAAG